MTLAGTVVNTTIKSLTHIFCRVEDSQLANVPDRGPLILVCNHVNFLEVPLVYTHLMPRPLTGLAKVETWDNPALRPLFNLWGAIPIRRGEADIEAVRLSLAALKSGQIVALAPEGTRSGHGRLQRGHPGVVVIALRSGAPLLPVVYYGGEAFLDNIKRLRRTNFHIAVGKPFRLITNGKKITQSVRQQMTDEIMYQLAALLPPPYRGYYSDLSNATEDFLQFDSLSTTNLEHVVV